VVVAAALRANPNPPQAAQVPRAAQAPTNTVKKIAHSAKFFNRSYDAVIPNGWFQFYKSSQLFIGTHNVTLSLAAMRVSNPDRSPVGIYAGDAAPAPTGLGIVDHLRRRPATADPSCGEFARFKSATGRTRCGELGAHSLDLRACSFRVAVKQKYNGSGAARGASFRRTLAGTYFIWSSPACR